MDASGEQPRLNGGRSLTEMEAFVRDRAAANLGALEIFDRATTTLAFMLQGLHVPPHPNPAPPTTHINSAVLNLSAIALRSARAVGVLVCSGYEPEAHGPMRRLMEAHARLQAVTGDRSGQHAKQWLEGKGPSTPQKLVRKYADPEIFSVYSESAHASYVGLKSWSILDVGGGQKMVLPQPYLRLGIANAMLVQTAFECRDFAALIGHEFTLVVPNLQRLTDDLRADAERYFAVPDDEATA